MHLLSDLLRAQAAENVPDHDTGSLVGDLVAMLTDVAAVLDTRFIRAILGSLATNDADQVAAARDAFWTERFRHHAVIGERAIARGELPPGADARLLLEHAISPVHFRLMVTGDPIRPADLEMFAQRAADAAGRPRLIIDRKV